MYNKNYNEINFYNFSMKEMPKNARKILLDDEQLDVPNMSKTL